VPSRFFRVVAGIGNAWSLHGGKESEWEALRAKGQKGWKKGRWRKGRFTARKAAHRFLGLGA